MSEKGDFVRGDYEGYISDNHIVRRMMMCKTCGRRFVRALGALFLLLLASCKGVILGVPDASDEIIEAYLIQRIATTSESGPVFCAYEAIAPMRQLRDGVEVFLWVVCQEYYLESNMVEEGTGISLPMSLTLAENESVFAVLGSRVPGEISQSEELVHQYFPRSAWRKIFPITAHDLEEYNARIERLEAELYQQAVEVLK